MKLRFDLEDFLQKVENSMYDAMEYYHNESRPYTPYDTGNLYENFIIELERTEETIIATGRWYGFADEQGNIIEGGYDGAFDYGQYQWDNHATKSGWGLTALDALIGNMRAIVREGIK